MRKIYGRAETVLSWLGPDTQDHQAVAAVHSIRQISDLLCRILNITISDLHSTSNVYQEIVLANRAHLPLPNECDFSTDATWKSLIWFYSHSYFTRVWVIQEIGANKERVVHCGHETVEWERVDLVAWLYHNGICVLKKLRLHQHVLLVGFNDNGAQQKP